MKTSTVVGLSILGVAVVGAAGAVVYVFTRKDGGPLPPPAPVVVVQQPGAVTPDNASKPPAVKEPSVWEMLWGGASTYACSQIQDPQQRELCLKSAPLVPKIF